MDSMTAAEALDAILARYGCVELVKAVREEMERAAAFMQCSIAAGGDLIAERDKLKADLAAARALLRDVRTYVPTHPYPNEKAVIDRIDAALAGKDAPK
jgi:hypothetical protein